MAKERYDAFPSRMSLQQFKGKKKAAALGHSLLKKKADALKARQRELLEEILQAKLELNAAIKESYFSHTKATYAAGDFNKTVLSQVSKAMMKLKPKQTNVTGVQLLSFDQVEDSIGRTQTHLGIARGGEQIEKCRKTFENALALLVKIGGLQTSFRSLEEAIKVTNRRVNALDCVVIPKMTNTVAYISSELDEREREDLFRLKKVIENKKKVAEQKEAEMKEYLEEFQKKHGYNSQGNALDQFSSNQDVVVDMF